MLLTVGHSEGLATLLDGCILEEVKPDSMGLESSRMICTANWGDQVREGGMVM
jgi:hypothetical protein